MFKISNTEKKVSVPKRNITISGVSIINGVLTDENGNIVDNLKNALPDPNGIFTIKISIELDEDE